MLVVFLVIGPPVDVVESNASVDYQAEHACVHRVAGHVLDVTPAAPMSTLMSPAQQLVRAHAVQSPTEYGRLRGPRT